MCGCKNKNNNANKPSSVVVKTEIKNEKTTQTQQDQQKSSK